MKRIAFRNVLPFTIIAILVLTLAVVAVYVDTGNGAITNANTAPTPSLAVAHNMNYTGDDANLIGNVLAANNLDNVSGLEYALNLTAANMAANTEYTGATFANVNGTRESSAAAENVGTYVDNTGTYVSLTSANSANTASDNNRAWIRPASLALVT